MNFDFSDDQRLLQEAVRTMLAENSTSQAVREVLEGRATHSTKVWQNLIHMGAAAAAIPEVYGGAGLGYLELCLVAEEAGRHLAAVPLSSSIYRAAEALLRAGSEAQKRRWLPGITQGEVIATAAFTSTERYRAPSPLNFDGQRLHGTSPILADGAIAQIAVLQVGNDLVVVDLNGQGVRRTALPTIDPTRPLAQIEFSGTPAERLETAEGAAVAARVLDAAAVLLAFEQVGGAARILELARDYSLERKAFGRQIGSFQALKHKMADIFTRIELARVHAYYGAWALSSDAPELPRAAAAARVAATRAFLLAAEEGIELHGGIGFTWEMDCHLYYRRARHLAQLIGSEHAWRARLADELIKEAA
ncbi:acyl-CoA/acyl-ACP dehydrogenase [Aromatoleum toluolicum]|uniref:Acyl-CoA dehydrogenase n=1 Tax=Aromatoleum toluolicum TaxID=90060 RepID=A0ABX1NJG6_9RHOO|nr:acyl-CoA dehydrogenase family protein [Aromatoleum toluolicum]NMF99442.1 acyl-CoA/acyl-ACP dehydrogenase [Aromatoleum toluolicum]